MNNNNGENTPDPLFPAPSSFSLQGDDPREVIVQFLSMSNARTLLDYQNGTLTLILDREDASGPPHGIILDVKGVMRLIWGLRVSLTELERTYIPPTPQY